MKQFESALQTAWSSVLLSNMKFSTHVSLRRAFSSITQVAVGKKVFATGAAYIIVTCDLSKEDCVERTTITVSLMPSVRRRDYSGVRRARR